MTDDTRRTNDWTGDEWAGDESKTGGTTGADPQATAATTGRWTKTEWVGDQGEGAPAPVDPDTMPEGDGGPTGNRHSGGESHWAGDHAEPATGDRPLDRP